MYLIHILYLIHFTFQQAFILREHVSMMDNTFFFGFVDEVTSSKLTHREI